MLVTLLTVSVIRTVVIEETAAVTLASPAQMVRIHVGVHTRAQVHTYAYMCVICVHECHAGACVYRAVAHTAVAVILAAALFLMVNLELGA